MQLRHSQRKAFDRKIVEASGDLRPLFEYLTSLRSKAERSGPGNPKPSIDIDYAKVASMAKTIRMTLRTVDPSLLKQKSSGLSRSLGGHEPPADDAKSSFSDLHAQKEGFVDRMDFRLPDSEEFDGTAAYQKLKKVLSKRHDKGPLEGAQETYKKRSTKIQSISLGRGHSKMAQASYKSPILYAYSVLAKMSSEPDPQHESS